MGNLPISGLPNLTASTNSSLIPIVKSGVTYNINILDFWKSAQPFGTMYQDWIPDAPSAHTIGSLTYPLKSVYVSTGSVFIGPNNSLAIDTSGVLYSVGTFAAPTMQVGNITSSGQVVTTSGITFSVLNNDLYAVSNSGGTRYNITKQLIPTGGTSNQVLTQTGNSNYNFGWVTPTQLVPTGGTQNQVLTKDGVTYGWSALTPTQIPTRYYGAFSSNVTQINKGANQINAMSADTTEANNGVILSANTRFVVQNAGVYNIQFSAQFAKTANGNDILSVWFRKNGSDIPRSNTITNVLDAGGVKIGLAAWNYVDTFNANDYIEIMWSAAETTMELLYQGTQTGPVRPATPSLIVTVTQV
jgi:hypothetical protein